VLAWLTGSNAAAVCLMLSLLERHRLATVPPAVRHRLYTIQKNLGGSNLRILHKLFDTYILAGRPFGRLASETNMEIVWTTLLSPRSPAQNLGSLAWNLLFPPSHPRRFDVQFQLRRIASALGLRRD
jgi:hypothetical protein